MKIRFRFYVWLTGLILVLAIPLRAQQDTTAMLKQAQELFTLGQYRKSLKVLRQVYKIMPQPILFWNMGRCLEEMKHYDEALRKYKQVLAAKVLTPEQRRRVQMGIERVKHLWTQQLLQNGHDLIGFGKVKAGNAAYQKAYLLTHNPGVLKAWARALKDTGHLQAALLRYRAYLDQAKNDAEKQAISHEIDQVKRKLQNKLLNDADLLAKVGNLKGALSLIAKAWELRHDPQCTWHRAQAYENTGNDDMAIKWYKKYIEQKPGSVGVIAARARIAALRKKIKASAVVKQPVVLPKPVANKGRSLKTGGYILAGVSGAVLATGVVFTLLANRDFSSLRNAKRNKDGLIIGMDQENAADLQSTARTERTVSWVMYGVGAAVAVTSVVMIVVGHKKAASVFATPTAGGASLGFETQF